LHRRRGHRSSTCREAEKGSCMPFSCHYPSRARRGGGAKTSPGREKHCSYCSHTPGRALVWVDEAPFLEASVATLDPPPPAVSSPSSPSILRPDVSLFTAEDRRRKRKEVREKSACMALAWLGWLVTTAEGFEVYQRSYRRPTSVPSRNLREHLSIIPLLECRGPLWLAVGAQGGTERRREAPCVALPGTYQVDG
jgi:hypothetical protein